MVAVEKSLLIAVLMMHRRSRGPSLGFLPAIKISWVSVDDVSGARKDLANHPESFFVRSVRVGFRSMASMQKKHVIRQWARKKHARACSHVFWRRTQCVIYLFGRGLVMYPISMSRRSVYLPANFLTSTYLVHQTKQTNHQNTWLSVGNSTQTIVEHNSADKWLSVSLCRRLYIGACTPLSVLRIHVCIANTLS